MERIIEQRLHLHLGLVKLKRRIIGETVMQQGDRLGAEDLRMHLKIEATKRRRVGGKRPEAGGLANRNPSAIGLRGKKPYAAKDAEAILQFRTEDGAKDAQGCSAAVSPRGNRPDAPKDAEAIAYLPTENATGGLGNMSPSAIGPRSKKPCAAQDA